MDERTRFFLWLLLSMASFGSLLALFGGVVGAVSSREGRSGGSALGLSFARAFAQLSERPLSEFTRAVLAGVADGFLFGVGVGLILGGIAGCYVPEEWRFLRPALLTTAALVALTIVLGLFANLVTILGTRAILCLFVGAVLGALSGFALAGIEGLFYGCLTGAAAGVLLLLPWR